MCLALLTGLNRPIGYVIRAANLQDIVTGTSLIKRELKL